jgi:hypothetical protein
MPRFRMPAAVTMNTWIRDVCFMQHAEVNKHFSEVGVSFVRLEIWQILNPC